MNVSSIFTKQKTFYLQLAVFALVSAAFANIYITQPVLPVLQQEFQSDIVRVSFTISAVILGIALSNLPFGMLADKLPIQPIVLSGGLLVALCGLFCALTGQLWVLVGARFFQGVFIPSMTTCLAAFLAKTLPFERLNVIMGAYVSATVLGGLSGRLIGGWIHPPLHWRYAFVSVACLTIVATIWAWRVLPRVQAGNKPAPTAIGYWALISRWDLLRIYFCAAGSFAVFSSLFNYLPFRLSAAPFNFSTETVTALYLTYIIGIFIGPIAGKISNRFGSGAALIGGGTVLFFSLGLILLPSIMAVIGGLISLCAGYFTIHAAAVGALNRKLSMGQGRANALYVLFYYVGGWIGITLSGILYSKMGWAAVVCFWAIILLIPIGVGFKERKN
jgi:YNFM family putative membrane transporter